MYDPNIVLDSIEASAQAEIVDGDVEVLAHLFEYLDTLKTRLSVIHGEVMARLAEVMPHTLELDGLPVMERRVGKDRKAWQSSDLLHHLIRDTLDPNRTGEIPDAGEAIQLVETVVLETMPVTPSMGWRVTALKARGVDPDEWATVTPGRVTVQIHRPEARP
jgi:hypothetical protein